MPGSCRFGIPGSCRLGIPGRPGRPGRPGPGPMAKPDRSLMDGTPWMDGGQVPKKVSEFYDLG